MIQSAFVDMESMFDLLTEEKEVSSHWTFCSQAKGKSKSVYTEQVLVTLRPLWMCQCWSCWPVSVDLLSWPPALTQVTPPSFGNPLSEVTQPTAGRSSTLPLDSIHMQIILLKPLFDLHISFYIFAKAVWANLQSDSWKRPQYFCHGFSFNAFFRFA